MSRIEVKDLVSLVQFVEQNKGKYAKQTLRRLEREGLNDPITRKHVLDGMNSFARSIYRRWYDVEE